MRIKEMKPILGILIAGAIIFNMTGCQKIAYVESDKKPPVESSIAVGEPTIKDPLLIRDTAMTWISEVMKEAKDTITDTKAVTVENYDATESHAIWSPAGQIDIKGIATYKVSFPTSKDDILGPITVYLDRSNMAPLGSDYRR